MKIIDLINGPTPVLSFEVFPPKTNDVFDKVMQATMQIAALHPAFMSVTYGAGGGTSRYTAQIATSIKEAGVTPLAHLSCICSTRAQIQTLLTDLKNRGIENILALRGDIPQDFDRETMEYHYASELAADIRAFGGLLHRGRMLSGNAPGKRKQRQRYGKLADQSRIRMPIFDNTDVF